MACTTCGIPSPTTPPPGGGNGCLRVLYECQCILGVSTWVLNSAACVANGLCAPFPVAACTPTLWAYEAPNACTLAAPLPVLPTPAAAGCAANCCGLPPPPVTTPPPPTLTPPPVTTFPPTFGEVGCKATYWACNPNNQTWAIVNTVCLQACPNAYCDGSTAVTTAANTCVIGQAVVGNAGNPPCAASCYPSTVQPTAPPTFPPTGPPLTPDDPYVPNEPAVWQGNLVTDWACVNGVWVEETTLCLAAADTPAPSCGPNQAAVTVSENACVLGQAVVGNAGAPPCAAACSPTLGCTRTIWTCQADDWVMTSNTCLPDSDCAASICDGTTAAMYAPGGCVLTSPATTPAPVQPSCDPVCAEEYCRYLWTVSCAAGAWGAVSQVSVTCVSGTCAETDWAPAGDCTRTRYTCVAQTSSCS